ncbi:MAG TPA: class I SAM-dependent methyltransferase [Acidobacteriaceae bacterium]|nr:class I SAM-dependent methyltransferase [Acidobacteriaceae bacterium]
MGLNVKNDSATSTAIAEDVCLACGSSRLAKWFTKRSPIDNRSYPLIQCKTCKSAFVMPRPAAEYLEAYYSGSTSSLSRDMVSHTEREQYEKVLQDEREFPNSVLDAARIADESRAVAPGTQFLDVGAGYGFFSRAALDRGFDVTAIEPTKDCRDIFRIMNGYDPLPGMLSAEFARANAGRFHVVLMSQVLEHVVDLGATVRQMSELLASNGIAVIAVPHIRSWLARVQGKRDMFITPPEHLNFFSAAGLSALFQQHGFHCCKIHTVSRLNVSRVSKKIGVPVAGGLIAKSLHSGLRMSDRFDSGMFLNAYFRKNV